MSNEGHNLLHPLTDGKSLESRHWQWLNCRPPHWGRGGHVLFRDSIKDIRDIYDIYGIYDTFGCLFIFLLQQT